MSATADIFDIFLPLERAGPGDGDSLRWALAVAGTRPDACILEAGCGTGADLPALLAAAPDGQITAIDTAAAFIARVTRRFPAVQALVADMAAPPGGPYDLIWSAGAVYNLGLEAALGAWRGHLAPGGRVAFSDLCWTGPARPEPALAFWQGEGLHVEDAPALEARVRAAGWHILGTRWLGQGGWAAYYEPLAERLRHVAADPALAASFAAEIALWREFGASYDYRLIVAEPR